MRSRTAVTVLACTIVLALGWAGCDDQPTSPPEAEETEAQAATEDSDNADLEAKIERLINAIFPSGQARSDANDTFSDIKSALAQGNTDEAQSQMFDFVDGLLEKARAGELQDPKGERIGPETAREGAAKLTRLYFEFVGLEAPPITARALQESGGADVVSPDEATTVKTGNGKAAVDIPANSFNEPALVTAEKHENPDRPGQGPLPASHFPNSQHPPFYDVEATTQPGGNIVVGTCVPTSGPLAPDSDQQDDLQLVKTVSGSPGETKFLPRVSGDFLNCGSGELALAGETDAFSTFGSGSHQEALSVRGGWEFSCALRGDGQVFCWGSNDSGKLGDGTTSSDSLPVAVDQSADFVELSVGFHHACALTSGGQAYCWGANWAGQLGDGTTTDRHTPTAVDQSVDFVEISAAGHHTCARTSGDQAYCWGLNNRGQLGDGSTSDKHSPTQVDQTVDNGVSFVEVQSGFFNTCARTSSDQAYCWGWDKTYGKLGNGTPLADKHTPVKVDQTVDNGVSFDQLATGTWASCALTPGGQAYCWGGNFRSLLGISPGCSGFDCQPDNSAVPVAVDQSADGGVSFVQITPATLQHNCGITSGGQAYCWSLNAGGQLGDGTTNQRGKPTAVDQGSVSFEQITAGYYQTCAVASSGEVYCWGENATGAVGDGTTTQRLTPVKVGG